MRRIVFSAIAVSVPTLLLSQEGNAATFTILGEIDSQQCLFETGAGAVSASCAASTANSSVSLSARSELGSLGIRGMVQQTGTNPGGVNQGVIAEIGAYFSDLLTFGIDAGTFVLPVDIAGSKSVNGNGSFGGVANGNIGSVNSVGVTFGTTVIYSETSVFNGLQFVNLDSVGTLGISNVAFQIVGGQVQLNGSFYSRMECAGLFLGTTCIATSDFLTSARLLGASVFDEFGATSNTTITSQSGFDYRAGVEPHSIAAVPIPAAAWMLGIASLMLAGFGFRRGSKGKDTVTEGLVAS